MTVRKKKRGKAFINAQLLVLVGRWGACPYRPADLGLCFKLMRDDHEN